jgi:hypothetical protein
MQLEGGGSCRGIDSVAGRPLYINTVWTQNTNDSEFQRCCPLVSADMGGGMLLA